MAKWPCRQENCTRWAQSNGRRLCARHNSLYLYQLQQNLNDAEVLTSIRNNFNAAPAENVHNQINNNDNHHVADDPQPVGILPDGCQCLLPQPLPLQHPQIGNQANNNDNGNQLSSQ